MSKTVQIMSTESTAQNSTDRVTRILRITESDGTVNTIAGVIVETADTYVKFQPYKGYIMVLPTIVLSEAVDVSDVSKNAREAIESLRQQ